MNDLQSKLAAARRNARSDFEALMCDALSSLSAGRAAPADLPELTPEEKLHCDSMPADLVDQLWEATEEAGFVPGAFQLEGATALEMQLWSVLPFIHKLPAGKEQTDLEVAVHTAARKLQHWRTIAEKRLKLLLKTATQRNMAQQQLAAAQAECERLREQLGRGRWQAWVEEWNTLTPGAAHGTWQADERLYAGGAAGNRGNAKARADDGPRSQCRRCEC